MVPTKIVDKIAKDMALTKEELILGGIAAEIRRKLATYKYIDYVFSKKYKMSFFDFEKNNLVAKKKYSYEAEEDYQNWDQAIDAIKTLERDLRLIKKP